MLGHIDLELEAMNPASLDLHIPTLLIQIGLILLVLELLGLQLEYVVSIVGLSGL